MSCEAVKDDEYDDAHAGVAAAEALQLFDYINVELFNAQQQDVGVDLGHRRGDVSPAAVIGYLLYLYAGLGGQHVTVHLPVDLLLFDDGQTDGFNAVCLSHIIAFQIDFQLPPGKPYKILRHRHKEINKFS